MRNFLVGKNERLYALKELARRSGIGQSFFETWQVSEYEEKVFVKIPDCENIIIFPIMIRDVGTVGAVSYFDWPINPSNDVLSKVPNFIVPLFSNDVNYNTQINNKLIPLFLTDNNGDIICQTDLLASIVANLGRVEELCDNAQDKHGRSLLINSSAGRYGYVNRPIVDEYGLAFSQILQKLLPSLDKIVKKTRILISHDLDEIGLPFRIRRAAGHSLKRKRWKDSIRDIASLSGFIDPADLRSVSKVVTEPISRGIESAVYCKTTPTTKFDSGYDLNDWRIRRTLENLERKGVEIGIHPGYDSFDAPWLLNKEVDVFKKALAINPRGGRQHFLRWNPRSWTHWEDAGLEYDSSVGYSESSGFKAGTCYPYYPWLFNSQRQSFLVELPLIAMDVSLLHWEKNSYEEAIARALDLHEKCNLMGGVYTLLWHNSAYWEKLFHKAYIDILDAIAYSTSNSWKEISVW